MKNAIVAMLVVAMLVIGFGTAFFLKPSTTLTTTVTTTLSPTQGSAFELNCVVTFRGGTAYAATISGTVTTITAGNYTSLLKDYTTTTSVSSEPGAAVSTTTALTSAQGLPIWNETVCTWLSR